MWPYSSGRWRITDLLDKFMDEEVATLVVEDRRWMVFLVNRDPFLYLDCVDKRMSLMDVLNLMRDRYDEEEPYSPTTPKFDPRRDADDSVIEPLSL